MRRRRHSAGGCGARWSGCEVTLAQEGHIRPTPPSTAAPPRAAAASRHQLPRLAPSTAAGRPPPAQLRRSAGSARVGSARVGSARVAGSGSRGRRAPEPNAATRCYTGTTACSSRSSTSSIQSRSIRAWSSRSCRTCSHRS